jgi:hypothetical protein
MKGGMAGDILFVGLTELVEGVVSTHRTLEWLSNQQDILDCQP